MSTGEDGQEASIYSLTDAGKQARVQQILEKQDIADKALMRRDELGAGEVYKHVKRYVQQFEGIAHKQNFTDFLHHRNMGEIGIQDVKPMVENTVDFDDVTIQDPDRYPITVNGAAGFISLNQLTVTATANTSELSSKREPFKIALHVPVSVSEQAFREAEKFRANIGLELEPGEIDVMETDPV